MCSTRWREERRVVFGSAKDARSAHHQVTETTSDRNFSQETNMNAEISAKFTAFAAAFTMNCLIFSGVAYMFDPPVKQRTAEIADSGQR
jgi:hypothetical protein